MIRTLRFPTAALATCLALGACAGAPAPDASDPAPARGGSDAPTVVQPGAPGEASTVVTAESLADRERPSWTEADAAFMRGMIHHHAQALQMTALIPERSASPGVHQMGLRMEISQRDEIRLMQDWLEARGLDYPEVVLEEGPTQGMMPDMGDHAAMGHDPGGMPGGLMAMPGMLSAEQMAELRAAEGDTFDRLFLEYMIQHHTGALVMVDELFATPGAAQDSKIDQFAADVDADQRAEMDRMRMLLARYR